MSLWTVICYERPYVHRKSRIQAYLHHIDHHGKSLPIVTEDSFLFLLAQLIIHDLLEASRDIYFFNFHLSPQYFLSLMWNCLMEHLYTSFFLIYWLITIYRCTLVTYFCINVPIDFSLRRIDRHFWTFSFFSVYFIIYSCHGRLFTIESLLNYNNNYNKDLQAKSINIV